ncbi:transcription termination/antitermination protein NusG [Bradyrhizobium sp. SZCCHNRI2007]|uniref:transcription termination/antitermination protein NusG n=1 Tax=Bradyrhizobium sp. SZCCHNRI2007 TaxID=3057281 RepID=UPI0028EE7A83|nr:transcription termination/antitermination NusG family protein [Bradyrhizobium sp. SZCCHNRI2007]
MTYQSYCEERFGAYKGAPRQPVNYQLGEHVGMVDLVQVRGPAVTPMPQKWYVLQTYERKERKVMRTFRDRGISAYHPVVRRTEIRRGRKIDSAMPLFAGLIFIPDFQAKLGGVLGVEGVDGYLKIGDYYPFLPEVAQPVKRAETPIKSRFIKRDQKLVLDMVGIRQIEGIGNIPASRKRRLYLAGEMVRVVDGPFAWFTGAVEHLDSKGRLRVLLSIFGRMTSVELDEGQIEAA